MMGYVQVILLLIIVLKKNPFLKNQELTAFGMHILILELPIVLSILLNCLSR
jgi:hypothetical protein